VLAGHAAAPNRARGVCWTPLFLGGVLALAGCGQEPGFELVWRIADTQATDEMLANAPPLVSVKQCSDVGIFWVHVKAKLGEAVVWEDEVPCFSLVEAPPLEPGEYTLEVEGRRRNGEPWAFDSEAGDPRIAYAEVSVIVSEDAGEPASVEAFLRAPPGCDDGIDNDLDGTVDTQDPGCRVETPAGFAESNDADLTLFELAVTFLDSPVVAPDNVHVDGIRLEVVDTEFERTILSYELDLTQWPFRLPLLTGEFDVGGELQLMATAFGAGGDLTAPQTIPFNVLEGEGTYVNGQFDFGSAMFLQPIVEPISLVFEPGCSPGGVLELDRMRVRVTDENDAVLDAATLGLSGSTIVGGMVHAIAPVDEAGWISFECPSSFVTSNPLPWGRYRIEAQAQRATDTCFESPLLELAPQPFSAQTIGLERLLIGSVPVCSECSEDEDCSAQICEAGLCVDKEPGQ
jgi:hypothetical protein